MPTENQKNPPSLETIAKDLDALKRTRESAEGERAKLTPSHGAAKGAVDFLSAMAVCSLIGYGIDRWVGTLPWGLIVGLLIGAGVGAKMMLNDVARGN